MARLLLNTPKVDTYKAEEYLNKYDNFSMWPPTDKFWQIYEYPIHSEDGSEFRNLEFQLDDCSTPALLGRRLAKKVEENAEMFIQLEYLIRKTNVADVKHGHIKLLTQHLQCSEASWSPEVKRTLHIEMNDNDPLYKLGCVASHLYVKGLSAYISATPKTAPLCYLFVELCREVGLEIPLVFFNEKSESSATDQGTVGVVTESADIDSAIDVFINSSVTAPWRLQKLFVQESIYEEWKNALGIKGARESYASCVDAFRSNDKIFLCDNFNTELSGDRATVTVEAYRTSKELVALLSKRKTVFLSVWGADSAVTGELAYNASASVTWINELATFEGPPRASLPLFYSFYPRFSHTNPIHYTISESSSRWMNLEADARIDAFINALKAQPKDIISDNMLESILKWQSDSFVSVNKGKVCYGIQNLTQRHGVVLVEATGEPFLSLLCNSFFDGICLAISTIAEPMEPMISVLQEIGVPVYTILPRDKLQRFKNVIQCYAEQPLFCGVELKVIYTNYGSIFAN